MIKSVTEQLFRGTTGLYSDTYDSTKTMLGQHIQQKTGSGIQNYAGPFPLSVARQFDDAGFGGQFPCVINFSSTLDWVFMADVTASSAFARFICYTFNKATQVWTYMGKVQVTLPSGTHTVRGFSVQRYLYNTGFVTRSNGSDTFVGYNSGTFWTDNRIAGGRIGVGSALPDFIGGWRHITAVTDNTHLTVTETTGSSILSSYVIEELRIYLVTTCTTADNSGLYVVKGVDFDDFISGGTTFSAATTVDNALKKVYFLRDNASTQANTAACGIVFSPTLIQPSKAIMQVR
jgi:hypothetical protein